MSDSKCAEKHKTREGWILRGFFNLWKVLLLFFYLAAVHLYYERYN